VDAVAWSAVLSETVDAVDRAVRALDGDRRRAVGDRAGQYHLDLIAEAAALEVLAPTGARVLSEEAGFVGEGDPTVVMDPVDGSTNFSHGVPHSACSLCVVDGDGPWVALVVNLATGEKFQAVRGEGARHDGQAIAGPSGCAELSEALVAVTGWPGHLGWSQFRAFGAAALDICNVAAGRIDAFVDPGSHLGVWDYLGALLVCTESGVAVGERSGKDLLVLDPSVQRGPVVAATPELRDSLTEALVAVDHP